MLDALLPRYISERIYSALLESAGLRVGRAAAGHEVGQRQRHRPDRTAASPGWPTEARPGRDHPGNQRDRRRRRRARVATSSGSLTNDNHRGERPSEGRPSAGPRYRPRRPGHRPGRRRRVRRRTSCRRSEPRAARDVTEIELGRLSKTLTLEVAQHIGDDHGPLRSRCSRPTAWSAAPRCFDTGAPITVPVGDVDQGPRVQRARASRWTSPERARGQGAAGRSTGTPPAFDQLESKTEMFETGIKVIDLLTPYVTSAARSACSVGPAWARRCSSRR